MPVIPARDCFAVDDARAEAQAGEGLDDLGKAVGEVVAGAAVELHPLVVLTGYDPKPVVLDFVQPDGAGGRLRG